ncbi:MAG: hydantoinase/oxoprolinase family protein [Gammaproteobacteria bacterium]|nr:hydantoinase/oxoprolinase family protein [Gammaproteobacteria bacterium]
MISIGVDVGGTNTDAVILEDRCVIATHKTPTTHDITSGIRSALRALTQCDSVRAEHAHAITIGTTHFVNAVVQRRSLNRVAALRICLPSSASLLPFVDWPSDLAVVVDGGKYLVGGGNEYDGAQLAPLDERAIADAARRIRADGVGAVAITAVFSPLTNALESRAAEIVLAEHPEARITLSSDIGRIGLLERENATLLNGSLMDLAAQATDAFAAAVSESGMSAPLFITRNDGTVSSVADARRFPVFSFASGPTNSMRGAVFISDRDEAMVCDVGGTTTDIGFVKNGFPTEANNVIEVGGVRTLFRMPDVLSIALGGGTIVEEKDAGGIQVGPRSVGHTLSQNALAFGGTTLTLSDIAVATRRVVMGDASLCADIRGSTLAGVERFVEELITESVDRMKATAADVPVIAVGGGAMLVPDVMPGVSEVVRVAHHDVANAVGAAIAEVPGEIDRVYRDVPRAEAMANALSEAEQQAIAAGADPAQLRTVEMEDLPLAYLPGNALRVRVRVVGPIGAAKPAG